MNEEDNHINEMTREELIQLIKKLTQENQSLRELLDDDDPQKKSSDLLGPKVEFGSFGSSNVMFLKNESDNERSFVATADGLRETQTYRGSGIFGPNVTDHRNLFKKSVVLEYEADSPAFRKKIEIMVIVLVPHFFSSLALV
jgi:hypothetical protein